MVILGGLELVAAGYLLKEVAKDSKEEEERDRDRRRRRRRRHSRDDHHHHHHSGGRYDDSPLSRPNRPPHQNSLYPPSGPPRPNSAPPAQNGRPPMPPGPPPPNNMMWQQQQQHPQTYPQGPPPSHGTWPLPQQQPPHYPQWPAKPPQQQHQHPRPQQDNPNNFVPPPLQRPATVMLPPPGMHLDMKTGKWQNNMYPPEMSQGQNQNRAKRDVDLDGYHSNERMRRENSNPPHNASQPQINVSPPTARPQAHSFSNSAPSLPQGLAELDAETPGRYRPHGNEKYSYSPQRGERRGRAHSGSSCTTRYYDEDDMRDAPPAYRE